MKEIWLLVSGGYECDAHIAAFTTRKKAELCLKTLKIQIAQQDDVELDGDVEEVSIQCIKLDPKRVGYWRYWIIQGQQDDSNFSPLIMNDKRWPSYDMISDGKIVGACGLGWTKEEAKAAAISHIKRSK